MEFPTKVWMILTAGVLAVGSLRAQDDTTPGPPPPDNGSNPDNDNGESESSASFQTFYDSLGSQGTWIQSSDYGYVWQPDVTDPDWAPYTDGHWVYTDDGWTWVSDESWGWATYHYGRWVNLDGTGWCWVPGYTWAPAWVSWRYGDGYCGWAPLPPDSFVGIDYFGDGLVIGVGFHIGGDCDNVYGIGAGCYHFVPVNCLGYAHYHGYYVDPHHNYALINHTTNVTNINVTHNTSGSVGARPFVTGGRSVTVGGPSLAQINAVSQIPVQHVSLVRSSQPGGGGRLANNSLALFAPRLNPANSSNARPTRVAKSLEQVTINRGMDITRPLAVNARLVPSPATAEQIEQAQAAQDHAPARAKVVTAVTPVNPVLQAPLTTMRPVTEAITEQGLDRIPNSEREPGSGQVVPTVRTPDYSGDEGQGRSSHVYEAEPNYPTPSATPTHIFPSGASGESTYRPSAAPFSSVVPASGNSRSTGGNSGGGEGNRGPSGGGNGGGYQGGGSSGGGNKQGH